MSNFKGFTSAIVSAVTFGMIPLFTLPLLGAGMGYDSILIYRYLIAAVIMAFILLGTHSSFKITKGEANVLAFLSLLYVGSSYFLFWSYKYLSSGIATSIVFLYPVFVTTMMMFIYKSEKSFFTIVAVLIATFGVGVLSIGEYRQGASIAGIFLALLSSLSYAFYIIGINKSIVSKMPSFKLTLYVLCFGTIVLTGLALLRGGIDSVSSGTSALNLALLAVVPTVVSNATLVYALKNIGSIITSVLGALEPIAAVSVGVLVFHEPMSQNVVLGIFLIIVAVILIVLSRRMDRHVKAFINGLIGHLGLQIR